MRLTLRDLIRIAKKEGLRPEEVDVVRWVHKSVVRTAKTARVIRTIGGNALAVDFEDGIQEFNYEHPHGEETN